MSASLEADREGVRAAAPRRQTLHIPAEGENGVFTQAWYAICPSSELEAGQVCGTEFLDGRIAVWRDCQGRAQVVSAYCPHLGARLDRGRVNGDTLRCPFHGFEYNREGRCVRTGIGAPPPPSARLFTFPTQERFGLIWAFNGTEPLWDLPDFEFPDDELHIVVREFGEFPADPYVLCCNTPDYHHYRTVHGLDWDHPDPDPGKDFRWTDHSFEFDLEGRHWRDTPMRFTFGIYSTSLYYQQGWLGDRWYGYLAPFKIVRPGSTLTWFVIATHKGDGSPKALAAAEAFAQEAMELEFEFVGQDVPILDGIHFAQGALTSKDLPLAMYLDMVRRQPRAHPSRDFIR